MLDLLGQEIHSQGDRFKIVSIERLEDLKNDLELLRNKNELNKFQRFITENMFMFELPDTDFVIRSIIIIASPIPSYARVSFDWKGKKIPTISLATSYKGKLKPILATKKYLTVFLNQKGYHIEAASQLPLKLLSVRSGLAEYGRNNICYVDGMGSFFTLVAYFTDIPSTGETWNEITNAVKCNTCRACIDNCPTSAILEERFLINNERCVSFVNEGPGAFPDWLPASAHHSIYNCIRCQMICPMNRKFISNYEGPIEFSEEETDILLSGKSINDFTSSLYEKVTFLGMDEWINAIPRNIQAIFNKYQ